MSNARDKANIPSLNFSSTGIDDNATSTAITIDSSENVGIGTASPSEKLEVNGIVKATQFVGGGLNPYRNIIINGDMSIAQRGTSATGLGDNDNGYHTVDRWRFQETGTPTFEFTQSQSTDVPSGQGFATSLKMDCTTAQGSLASDELIRIAQRVEGQNLQYLKKGTANAESLTASFWVKSNKTGTYILNLVDQDNTRQISKSYTIDSASTWEKKTLTFEGDTTGAFDNDNNNSLQVIFFLGAGTDYTSGTLATSWEASALNTNTAVGQVNLADSTANEWYVTGVQLEAGTTASDFEFLPVDVNLDRCYRYYQVITEGDDDYFMNGQYYTSTNVRGVVRFFQPMRTSASLDVITGTNYYRAFRAGSTDDIDNFSSVITNNTSALLFNSSEASGTAGQAVVFRTNDANSFIAVDAEL